MDTDELRNGNHIYFISKNTSGKAWLYFEQPHAFVSGATYRIEYDVKIIGTNGQNQNVSSTQIYTNLIYNDVSNNNHINLAADIGTDGKWHHILQEISITSTSTDRTNDIFSVYSNPFGELSVNYQIDNVRVTRLS